MKNINTGTGFSAHTDYEDLEKLGWDFSELYQGVSTSQDKSLEDAETWEKENYHVRLYNNGAGLRWIPSHNVHGDTGDSQDPGDQELAHHQIQELYNTAKLWEVHEGQDDDNEIE